MFQIFALTTATGQAGFEAAACHPILADTDCAGIKLPMSPLRPGSPQPPALERGWETLTGFQLPHPHLQFPVLGDRGGQVIGGTGSVSPTMSHSSVGYED